MLADPTPAFTIEGFTIRYTVTIFYDQNREDGEPTYAHKSKLPDDRFWDITMGDDGRLRKKDLGGRWRTVDESGTGVRDGSTRPPDVPGDAYELLRKAKKDKGPDTPASSSAVPVTLNVVSRPIYQNGDPTRHPDWHLSRDSEVPRAMSSIRELVHCFGAENVFIIESWTLHDQTFQRMAPRHDGS